MNSMSIHQLERFKDGALGEHERQRAQQLGRALALRIERENFELRRCRIGRVVDRLSPAERLARAMVGLVRSKGECLEIDLLDLDFTPAELRAHGNAARAIARRIYAGEVA